MQYFSSDAIHCAQCTRHEQGKKVRYSYNAIASVLMAPGHDYVVSLAPEFMTPQDGADKQDSEAAAARCWLANHSRRFAPWSVKVVTDDLVSHQPFCLVLHQYHCHYILVCKPESHAFAYEQLGELARLHLLSQCVSTCWHGEGQVCLSMSNRFSPAFGEHHGIGQLTSDFGLIANVGNR